MSTKLRNSGLFAYESHNYPDGTRKDVQWSIGIGANILLLLAIALAGRIPLDRILDVVIRWLAMMR